MRGGVQHDLLRRRPPKRQGALEGFRRAFHRRPGCGHFPQVAGVEKFRRVNYTRGALGLDLVELGFTRATPAATGRPGYDPADLLKLYVSGYLNRVRSSRLLEREATRNVEVM